MALIDDRLLIEELLLGLRRGRRPPQLCTTSSWYFRACRAAVVGAGGHLSGPFEQLPATEQGEAILGLLDLREDIVLPEPRVTVPAMARLAGRHPRLNLLNLEAAAAAAALGAEVWLSTPAVDGVLPSVLEAEGIRWREIALG